MKEGEEGKGERREDFTFVACFDRFIILFLLRSDMENGTKSGDRLGEGNSSAIAFDFNETHIVTGAGCGNHSLLWEGSSAQGFCISSCRKDQSCEPSRSVLKITHQQLQEG